MTAVAVSAGRVLVFTAQPVLAEGLRALLRSGGFEIAGVHESAAQWLETCEAAAPDLVIVDLLLVAALDIVPKMRSAFPQCAVVLWTERLVIDVALSAMESGVHGILSSTLSGDLLASSLRRIRAGEMVFHFSVVSGGGTGFKRVALKAGEARLLSLLKDGLKNKEIATALDTTENTVKTYVSRLLKRVGAKDRFELALFAMEHCPKRGEDGTT